MRSSVRHFQNSLTFECFVLKGTKVISILPESSPKGSRREEKWELSPEMYTFLGNEPHESFVREFSLMCYPFPLTPLDSPDGCWLPSTVIAVVCVV